MNEFPTHEEVQVLAAPYVLDALDGQDLSVFRDHVKGCSLCEEHVRELRETLALVGSSYEVAAPTGSEERLMRAIAGIEQSEPSSLARGDVVVELAPRARSRRTLTLVAASIALFLVLAAGSLFVLRGVNWASETQQVMAVATARDAHLMPAPMASASPSYVLSMSMNKAAIMATAMPMPAAGHIYEVWAKTRSGSMVAVGMFTPSKSGHVAKMLTANLHDTTALMLTVEPSGGSSRPTQPPFAEVQV